MLKPPGPLFRHHAVTQVLLGFGLSQGEVLVHVERLPCLDLPLVLLPEFGWHQAPRQFTLPATADWQKLTLLFNSLNLDKVRLYAGMWGGKAGKFWLDDWTIEEVGPINGLHRPGTPVTVRSTDGATTYAEGKDYAPLRPPNLNPYRDTRWTKKYTLLPAFGDLLKAD